MMADRRQLARGAGAAGLLAAAAGFAQLRHTRRVAADPERRLLEHPPEGRPLSIRSADGTHLHAEVFGLDDGPTLILIHGWTEALRYWVYVTRELASDFRIVAYDLRGHGRSGRAPGGDYSLERFGDDVEAVLEAVAAPGERALLAGHSLGGMSIAAWAEHHDVGARARGAALLFTGIGGLVGGQLLIHVPRFAQALADPIARHTFFGARAPLPRVSTPLSYAAIRYATFGPSATPAQVAFYEQMVVACPPDVRAKAGLAMQEMDLYPALPRLTIPTLVMAGENDRLTPPSHARRIAEELPNLEELVILPDTGHMGPLERPVEVASALRKLSESTQRVPETVIGTPRA
jgi:pimeloyl-ACP methyl ester carboxylesterase